MSAISGVTRIVPALGILLCLSSLLRIGNRLGFGRGGSAVAAVMTIALGQVFEVFSVGSLWGISMFLIGVLSLDTLKSAIDTNSNSYSAAWIAVVIITPLLTLAQSTLGLHFVLLTCIIYASTGRRILPRLRSAILGLLLQSTSVILLRLTLLSSDSQHLYQPSLSIRNFMQFRGVDLYVGTNFLYVFGSSMLYLLVISQLLAGIFLVARKESRDRRILTWLASISIPSLLLANVFSIGDTWAQQARFLVPMIVFGTFVSFSLIARNIFSAVKKRQHSFPTLGVSVVLGIISFTAILASKYFVFGLPWSRTRTAAVALTIICVEVFLVVVVVARRIGKPDGKASVISLFLLLSIAASADGQQLRDLIGIHRSDFKSRAESILGDSQTQICLNYVRDRTSKDSIVASNWFKIPTTLRESKYFLVSSNLERRTFIDGPNYIDLPKIDTPRPTPIEKRALVAEGFAERASPESYEVLRSYGVEYFLVDRLEVVPDTWQPYADVVLENVRCFVLKLAT
jgi:hypothetical protein